MTAMPILSHFGLRDYPFQLSPSPSMFFTESEHHAVLLSLLFALERGDGLLQVSGEVGTGKTMICRMLARVLQNRANICLFSAPTVAPRHLPLAVLRGFGQEGAPEEAHRILQNWLLAQHGAGRRNLLLIDEAQALGVEGLEAVRLLANLEGSNGQLLQIVLFGQPELERLIKRGELRQVAQRISFCFSLRPLPPNLIDRYIEHRVGRMQQNLPADSNLFAGKTLSIIAAASRGLPRIINLLADKAMLAAYADGASKVGRRHVLDALREVRVNGARLPWRYRYDWVQLALLLAAAGLAFAGGIGFVWAFGAYLR